MIDRSYIICATARSGSTLLCRALSLAGAGRPDEHLLPWHRDSSRPFDRADLAHIVQEGTANGIFGIKLMWPQLERLATALSDATGVQDPNHLVVLSAVFPGAQYVYIVRNDTVRQAVSLAKAIRSGQWERRLASPASFGSTAAVASTTMQNDGGPPPTYDRGLIEWCYRRLQDDMRAWSGAFAAAGVEPRRIEYEQLAAGYETVAESLLNYLKLPVVDRRVFAQLDMQRQADAVNEEWVDRFRQESPSLA